MGEQDALKALGVLGEWIWGDDDETSVFVFRPLGIRRHWFLNLS